MIDNSKKILTGTLSFFAGLLAGKKAQTDKQVNPPVAKPKKRSGYFMELDESEDANLLTQPVAAVKQVVEKAKTSESGQKVAAEPVATKKSKIELVQTAEGLKAEPVKPSISIAASSNGQNKTETTFAPKYLNPANNSTSRRRPGANMTNFLDMANQVKKPAKD